MEGLVFLQRNEVYADSLSVAERFSKSHRHVLGAIEKLIRSIKEDNAALERESNQPKIRPIEIFKKSEYIDSRNRAQTKYLMNRDAFALLVQGFTALHWKRKYNAAFNAMEKALAERMSLEWKEARAAGKAARRELTDALKALAEYAKGQGSANSGKLYMVYTRLVNKALGLPPGRDGLTAVQLGWLIAAEDMVLRAVLDGMDRGLHYKEIYRENKAGIDAFAEHAAIPWKGGAGR